MEEQSKWLLAWLNEDKAIVALLGPASVPGEELGHLRRKWQEAKAALMRRHPYRQTTRTLSPFQGKLKERATAYQQRPDVVHALQGLDWGIGNVDLRWLLSFRWSVIEQDAVKRAEVIAPNDPDSLFSFCLPEYGQGLRVASRIDADRKAITFRSLDPKLGIGLPLVADVEVSPGPGEAGRTEKFMGFPVHFGVPFIQVVEFRGRLFLKDGYHRCYGLLRRSIHKIPCVCIRARDLAETGAAETGSIPYDILFGDRPPYVSDFLDDSVSQAVTRVAQTKMVRVTAAEFAVELL